MTAGRSPEKFDLVALYDALSPAEQRRAALAALLLGYCERGLHFADGVGFDAATGVAIAVIDDVLPAIATRHDLGHLPLPDLAPFGVRACRDCGCTDAHACAGDCSWVDDDLCSACAPARGFAL